MDDLEVIRSDSEDETVPRVVPSRVPEQESTSARGVPKNFNLNRPNAKQGPNFNDRMIKWKKEKDNAAAIEKRRQELRIPGFSIEYAAHSSSAESKDSSRPSSSRLKEIGKEQYSQLALSQQYIDPGKVKQEFEGKSVLSVRQLLSLVRPPKFEPPPDPNFVVIGVVAQKSEVKVNKQGGSYYIFTLTDLDLELPLAVHGQAFDKYWKVRNGAVVAVLNPDIYVKTEQAGPYTFGLSITSDMDVLLELGKSAHLGRCASTAHNGNRCFNWVNAAKAQFCEYHIEQRVTKSRHARPEINSANDFVPSQHNNRWNNRTNSSIDEFGNRASYISAGKSANYDDGVQKKQEKMKKLQTKRKNLELESAIRKKLAKRADGFLLREFDQNGDLVEDPQQSTAKADGSRLFTPEHVRKIGFDPTGRVEQKATNTVIEKINPGRVNLTRKKMRPAPPPRNDPDDSDDLEII
uniref:ARAD1C21538p n=1 Tax=Blastobotrys adeninivorans TaxID=409370 RepID=A0A060T218_BLAAD